MIQARGLARLQLSAASGLVLDAQGFWVIADNLLVLHRYDIAGTRLATLPLPGADADEPERALPKPVKPDMEALLRLPDGMLLALGSGSRANRRYGYRVVEASGGVTPIDLSALYLALENTLPELNIEGAVIHGDALMLAHRGNSGGQDALIALDLQRALVDLDRGVLGAAALRKVHNVELGRLDDARLTLTDLAAHPDGSLWFSAAAEATDNRYDDGAIRGSAIGCLDDKGKVRWQQHIAPICKIEGLHWHASTASGGSRWLAVADADDPAQAAPLLELETPL